MQPWSKSIAVAVSAVLISFSAVAQTTKKPEPPRLGESIDVSIVNVDAIVTDRHGNRIRGLTKDDFEMLENGKAQAITNFADYTADAAAAAAGAPDAQAIAKPQPRTMIVFVEHFRAPNWLRDAYFQGLREFLHRAVRPGDAVKVVAYTDRVETRQDFTDDLGKLDAALASLAHDSGPGIDPVIWYDMLVANTFSAESSGNNARAQWIDSFGNAHDALRVPRTTALAQPVTVDLGFLRMREKVAAITALLNSMAGADAKKIFVMSVRQFMPSNPIHDYDALTGYVPSYGWSTRFRSDALIDYVSKTANANGVTIYPLFPMGIGREGYGLDAVLDYQIANAQLPFLNDVANATGGRLSWGYDIVKDLPKFAQDFDSYYSLAYRATTKNVDRARRIEVRTKNPAYSVRSRHEYVEKSDETRMRERVIANLFDQPAVSSMPITVEVGRSRLTVGGRYKVPVTVHIPTASLMTDGGRGEFSVFVGFTDVKGAIGPVKKETRKFAMKSDMPETFTYTFDVVGDRETNRLSVGVFDEVSKDYGLKRVELGDRVASF
jgi:VWFA-related protein